MFHVHFETFAKKEEGNHDTTTEENTTHTKRLQGVRFYTFLNEVYIWGQWDEEGTKLLILC